MDHTNGTFLRNIRVRNVRSITDATLELQPTGLTVLVGQNGSGKTSFIEAIGLPSSVARDGLISAIDQRWGIGSYVRQGGPGSATLELSFGDKDTYEQRGAYSVTFGDTDFGPGILQERLSDNSQTLDRAERPTLAQSSSLLNEPSEVLEELSRHVKRVLVHWSNASQLLEVHQRDKTLPMSQCSRNWASILDLVLKSTAGREQLLDAAFAVSGVRNLYVETRHNQLIVEAEVGNQRLSMNQMSSGTLEVLDLLPALFQPYDWMTLALDEPGRGIHTSAALLLVEYLRMVASDRQIVFTTHSEALIRQLRPEEIRVVSKSDMGTRVDKLLDRQAKLVEAGKFSLDQLLAIEGLRPAS